VTFLVLFMIAAIVFARHLEKPLQGIASAAERFGRGELSARTGVRRSDEIGVAAKAFDEMADRVTWLMTAQQELMANVSHELRTPLSRIHVAVDLLLDGVSDQAKELLPEIAHDLAELERLIDDVMVVTRLDLSRSRDPRAGTPLQLEPLSAEELLHKAAARFRTHHQTHQLQVEVAPGLLPLHADAVLLRRVLENLIDNARKYSEPGSVIRVSAEKSPRGIRFVVRDSGIGLDPADLQHVFTPFFRSDRSRSRSTGGVGLGLSLARRVVDAHDGTIDLESVSGHGTTVTMDLPLQPTRALRHSS
jgi:signal transduction histidine kinase